MSKYKYKRRPPFRITNKEAQVIGDAFEQCGSETGARGVSVAKFEAFCSEPSHPVHKIWKRQCEQVVAGAGREAAAYLMRAVQIIIIHPSTAAPVGRAFTTIQIEDKEEGRQGVGYHSVQVARSPDLLELAEQEMTRQVRGLAESFAAVAGATRMYDRLIRIATEVREQFGKSTTSKPKKATRATTSQRV